MRKKNFKIGDLVREKNFDTDAKGYGIIVGETKVGTSHHFKCLWSDSKTIWLKSHEICLIARGQDGSTS